MSRVQKRHKGMGLMAPVLLLGALLWPEHSARSSITHTIFVTSNSYTGDLKSAAGAETGLEGADQICLAHATSAGLTGEYKALISTSSIDAKDRIEIEGPVYALDENNGSQMVARTKEELFDTINDDLFSHIRYDQKNELVSGRTWSASISDGFFMGSSCMDWESSDSHDEGGEGIPSHTDSRWLEAESNSPCSNRHHLYCISQ